MSLVLLLMWFCFLFVSVFRCPARLLSVPQVVLEQVFGSVRGFRLVRQSPASERSPVAHLQL